MAMSYVYSTEQRKQVERRSTSNGVGFSDLAGESERISVRKSPPHSSSSPSSTSGQSFPVGQATSGERKKYFTQKYGQHQMQLIRKRLAVEEWLDEKLRAMYSVGPDDLYDCEIDMDEILDLDTPENQKQFLKDKLSNVRKPSSVINEFIDQVLQKAESL